MKEKGYKASACGKFTRFSISLLPNRPTERYSGLFGVVWQESNVQRWDPNVPSGMHLDILLHRLQECSILASLPIIDR